MNQNTIYIPRANDQFIVVNFYFFLLKIKNYKLAAQHAKF